MRLRFRPIPNLRELLYPDLREYYAGLTAEADRVAREIAYRDEFKESVAAGRTPGRYVTKPLNPIPTTIKPTKKKWWQA